MQLSRSILTNLSLFCCVKSASGGVLSLIPSQRILNDRCLYFASENSSRKYPTECVTVLSLGFRQSPCFEPMNVCEVLGEDHDILSTPFVGEESQNVIPEGSQLTQHENGHCVN
jgi:hypothetical protein